MTEIASLEAVLDSSRYVSGARDVERSTARMEQAARQARNEMGRFSRSTDLVGASSSRAALGVRSLFAGISATLAARQGINAIASYEQGLVSVGKTTGILGGELTDLGRQVQEIALRFPVATTTLLSIAQAAGSLGVTGTENIVRFTDTIAKLGTASDLKGEEAATTLARLLNVTRENVGTVGTLGSVIVRLGNEFAATEKEIAHVAERVAQSTSAFKVSSASAAGLAAAMQSVGIEAEVGGTTVGRVFFEIDKAVRAGGANLDTLAQLTGKSAEAFQKGWGTNQVETFRQFIAGLGGMIERGEDAAAVMGQFSLEGVRSLQVILTLAANSKLLDSALATANDELRKGTALEIEAARGADTLAGSWGILKNTVYTAAVAVGDTGFAKALRSVVDLATDVVRELIGMDARFKENQASAEFLAGAFKGLAAATGIIYGIRTAMWALNAAMAANPIGAVVVGIAALAGAYEVFADATFKIQGRTYQVSDVVRAVWGHTRDYLVFVFETIQMAALFMWEKVSGFAGEAFRVISANARTFFTTFGPGITSALGSVWGFVKSWTNNMIAGVATVIDAFGLLFEQIERAKSIAVALGAGAFTGGVQGFLRGMQSQAGEITKLLDFEGTGEELAKNALDNFSRDWVGGIGEVAGLGAEEFLRVWKEVTAEGWGADFARFMLPQGKIEDIARRMESFRLWRETGEKIGKAISLGIMPALAEVATRMPGMAKVIQAKLLAGDQPSTLSPLTAGGAAGMFIKDSPEKDAAKDAARSLKDSLIDVASGYATLEDATRSFGQRFLSIMLDSVFSPIENLAATIFKGIFSGVSGAAATTGAFGLTAGGGGVKKYAFGGFPDGQILTGPTSFYAGGKAGLAGEAGPEVAFARLKRIGGELGVKADISGGGPRIMNNTFVFPGANPEGFRRSERQISYRIRQSLAGAG